MGNGILERTRELRRGFMRRRHTALLVAIVVLLTLRPLMADSGAAPVMFSLALLFVMLLGLYNINIDELVGERGKLLAQGRRRRIVGWVLAAVATAERFMTLIAPSHTLYLVGSMSWLLFFAFVTLSELRALLKQKEVTGETISMSISAYLLIGLTWGLLFIFMTQLHPDAINLGGGTTPIVTSSHMGTAFPIIIYFSLTTLSTIGFGDITPVSLQARYAAVAEGITGQFYLAILVARLVGIQMNQAARRSAAPEPREPDVG